LKPVPISDEQFSKILQTANPESVENFKIYMAAVTDELEVIGTDEVGAEKRTLFSQLSEKERGEFLEALEKELKIIFTENIYLYRKVNIASFYNKTKDDFDNYELLECNNSASFFKIKDATGTIYVIQDKFDKVKKLPKTSHPKPPKTELGCDALRRLNK